MGAFRARSFVSTGLWRYPEGAGNGTSDHPGPVQHDLHETLERLEGEFGSSPRVPFTRQVLVDREACLALVDEVRALLTVAPRQVRRAAAAGQRSPLDDDLARAERDAAEVRREIDAYAAGVLRRFGERCRGAARAIDASLAQLSDDLSRPLRRPDEHPGAVAERGVVDRILSADRPLAEDERARLVRHAAGERDPASEPHSTAVPRRPAR